MTTARRTASAASSWVDDGRRVVEAVLAEIEHSAPLPLVATMLIDGHGNGEGSITGGCVESAVVHEAQAVLGGTAARLLTYGISDEVAGTAGLTCGTVHVIVNALEGPAADAERAVVAAVGGGRPAAIATVLDGASAGHQLALVDGELVGNLGAPDLLRRSVARDLGGVLEHGATTVRRYGADGAVLGAELRVLLRSFAAPPQMLIFGAIDFAAALAPLARETRRARQPQDDDASQREASRTRRHSRAARTNPRPLWAGHRRAHARGGGDLDRAEIVATRTGRSAAPLHATTGAVQRRDG